MRSSGSNACAPRCMVHGPGRGSQRSSAGRWSSGIDACPAAVNPDPMKRGEGERREFVHRGDRGELRMSLPAPTVLLMEYKGYSDEAFIPFIENVWDETFGKTDDSVQIFADTEHQTGYAHGFRTGLMAWSKRMVGRTDEYCLLVKSRWVAMGIAIVRSTVGLPAAHAEVTSNRDVFRSKLDAALQRSRARNTA